LKAKKNRIILKSKSFIRPEMERRSVLNGILEQEPDLRTEKSEDFKAVTNKKPDPSLNKDLEFASVLVKHTKSNAITIIKNQQLLASGTGQTSRVDALKQAVEKAGRMGFTTQGAVLASDAFFPFPDCVELSAEAGIAAIIQPGGSVKDQDSIDAANRLNICMVTTGIRHFKH
jgi:phosphoribosylaminoimidazolecarboxamide formyltransferase/IMP cyclohydrolase